MRTHSKITASLIAFLIIGVGAMPTAVLAQASSSSTNFKMDNIYFGDNLSLVTTQDSVPPEVSTDGPSVTELSHSKATIVWKTDKKSTSVVQYGTTTEYGFETGNSELVTSHEITIFGLDPETLYYYRVKSVDALGAAGFSEQKTFTTTAEEGINSIKVSDVSYTTALISWTTGNATKEELQYGLTTAYGESIKGSSLSFTTNHTVKLEGLKSGTEYHFRIVATTPKGENLRSNDFIFKTIDEPKFVSIALGQSTANDVVINWATNTETTGLISYSIAGGPILSEGTEEFAVKHATQISQLIGSTTYSYTITATDITGKKVTSAPQTFKTAADTTKPVIKDLKTTVTRSGEELILTITYKTNEPTKSRAIVAPKSKKGDIEIPAVEELKVEHTLIQTGIDPLTSYKATVFATDPFSNEQTADISFVSPSLRKNILTLILESVLRPFGWLSRVFNRT